jgi:hypothetical protein
MYPFVERFQAAIQALVADGPVKQRLARAYGDYLEDLTDVDLPGGACGALSDLHEALHRCGPMGREDAVRASIRKMSAAEATWHAETILKVYADLMVHARRSEPLKVVTTPADKPPRFLVGG